MGDKKSNKYEKIVVMSKRARQIAAQEKMELDEKLKYFEGLKMKMSSPSTRSRREFPKHLSSFHTQHSVQ
jgi:hypothetical protein